MIFGMDYLGGAKYPNVIKASHPLGWAAGFFDDTFGDCMPAVKAALSRGCRHIRIQLFWEPSHVYDNTSLKKIIDKSTRWENFRRQNQTVTVELSVFCEHNLRTPDKFLDVAAKAAPSCIIVNSPLKTGALSQKYKNEFHGAETKPRASSRFNFSFDGTACVDADVETYKKNYGKSDVFFFWDARFNGKGESNEVDPKTQKPIPIPNRKNWPDASLIESIEYLKNPKGAASLVSNDLWKSHSENKGNNDTRAEKPVYLSKEKSTFAELRFNGKVIGKLKRYPGDMPDGRARYYFAEMGYKVSKKYQNKLIEVWINNKFRGTVNPAFRQNEYRV